MAILNCLWIGALAGLVAARLIRERGGIVKAASSVAVGVLGALVGGAVDAWTGSSAGPNADLFAAAAGALLALILWVVVFRVVLADHSTKRAPRSSQIDNFQGVD